MKWVPRSGLDTYHDCCWLPRLIDKARYLEMRHVAGNELGNAYLYGDNDFIDGQLLRFLGLSGDRVRAIVAANASDEQAAAAIIAESRKTPEERRAFSDALRARLHDFYIFQADEHRVHGPKAWFIRFIYNYVLMPRFRRAFRKAERTAVDH